MILKFKCKNCEYIYKINLDGEYFLPAKCPSCGYQYKDDASLQSFIKEVKKQLKNGENFK